MELGMGLSYLVLLFILPYYERHLMVSAWIDGEERLFCSLWYWRRYFFQSFYYPPMSF